MAVAAAIAAAEVAADAVAEAAAEEIAGKELDIFFKILKKYSLKIKLASYYV